MQIDVVISSSASLEHYLMRHDYKDNHDAFWLN
jgi:hypothetical protein